MAFKRKSGVEYTTDTEGTGSLVLSASPVIGHTDLSPEFSDGDTSEWVIRSGSDVEIFIGTLSDSLGTLSRDTVLASTNGGSKVNWAAGTKYVALVNSAELDVRLTSVLNSGGTDAGKLVKVAATGLYYDLVAQGSGGGVDADKLDGKHYSDVNPITTRGDVIVGGASGVPGRLAVGASSTFLKSDGTDPAWAALAASDVASGTFDAARIPAASDADYIAGTSTTKFLTPSNRAAGFYRSSSITVTAGAGGYITPGFNVANARAKVYAVCDSADLGYSAVQSVEITPLFTSAAYNVDTYRRDATTIGYTIGSGTGGLAFKNTANGNVAAAAAGKWHIIIEVTLQGAA